MKLKNRQDDASAPELNEWLKMYDWFAELRDDDPAGPADHGLAEPADDSAPRPRDRRPRRLPAGLPPVAGASAGTEASARAATLEITPPPAAPGATRREASAPRATIGDQLRRPVAWCEMGSCIWHHADPAALGEADVAPARSRPAGASMPSADWPAPDASRPAPASGPPARLPCGTGTTPSPRPP